MTPTRKCTGFSTPGSDLLGAPVNAAMMDTHQRAPTGRLSPHTSTPSVSVVIRNRNESTCLSSVLQALAGQSLRPVEVIVVDNESSDDSVEIARSWNARVIHIPTQEFTYGGALNLGIAASTAEICVILSAHALPLGPHFLTECARPFADPRIAAVRCMYAGKSADAMRWLQPELLDSTADVDTVVSKGPLASGCAIRRRVWEELPFDADVIAAEDKLWAAAVLQRGYLIYSPCPAFYRYIKRLSPSASVRKNNRELLEIYRSTGVLLGAARRSMGAAVMHVACSIFFTAPRAALVVLQHIHVAAHRLLLVRDVRRIGKARSAPRRQDVAHTAPISFAPPLVRHKLGE